MFHNLQNIIDNFQSLHIYTSQEESFELENKKLTSGLCNGYYNVLKTWREIIATEKNIHEK
jgi:hypothetical protein